MRRRLTGRPYDLERARQRSFPQAARARSAAGLDITYVDGYQGAPLLRRPRAEIRRKRVAAGPRKPRQNARPTGTRTNALSNAILKQLTSMTLATSNAIVIHNPRANRQFANDPTPKNKAPPDFPLLARARSCG
jgi:hypothetical protein